MSDEMSVAKHDFEAQLVWDLAVSNSSKIYKDTSSFPSSHQLRTIHHAF